MLKGYTGNLPVHDKMKKWLSIDDANFAIGSWV
jgi:hypothetical protein